MADETFATVANLLREQRGPLVEAIRWSTVLLAEIERDMEPESFDGEKVKIPVILAPHQGGGMITESGTLNTPKVIAHDKVRVDTGIAAIPVSFTTKATAAAKGGQNAWIDLIPDKMEMAERGLRRIINEQMCGSGDALLAAVTVASGGASTTVTVGVDANFHQLYADRVIDVLVRTNGATLSLARTVVDYDEDAGTIELDAAIDTLTTHGLYIEGSYGNASQGLEQAAADTGTFQELSKDNIPQWRGVQIDADGGDPTIALLDRGERRVAGRSGETPPFYIGDPAVIDKYTHTLSPQARWAGDNGQLETGYSGVLYRNKVLVREYDISPGKLFGVPKQDMRVYTRDDGPDWDEVNGMFKRFARSLPFEAWLVWQFQLGFKRCAGIVEYHDVRRAV